MRRWEDGREGRPDPAAAPARPGAVLAGLAVVPLSGEFPALVGSLAVVFALVALSFVILTGWTGYVSLGQVVPYGLGAYGTFVLSDRLGLPVLAAVDLRVRHVRAPQTFSVRPWMRHSAATGRDRGFRRDAGQRVLGADLHLYLWPGSASIR